MNQITHFYINRHLQLFNSLIRSPNLFLFLQHASYFLMENVTNFENVVITTIISHITTVESWYCGGSINKLLKQMRIQGT